MADITYQCGRCGKDRPGMRLPDEWSAETIAKWQALEERFVCSDCESVVAEYAATVLGD